MSCLQKASNLPRDLLQIHVVFYERLLRAFDVELAALLTYLGTDLDDGALAELNQEVSFQSMKARGPHHVRKGMAGTWGQVLTSAQKERAVRIAGPC